MHLKRVSEERKYRLKKCATIAITTEIGVLIKQFLSLHKNYTKEMRVS